MLSKFLFLWSVVLVTMRSLSISEMDAATLEVKTDLNIGPLLNVRGGDGSIDFLFRDPDNVSLGNVPVSVVNGAATINVSSGYINSGHNYQINTSLWANAFGVPNGVVYYRPVGASYAVFEPSLTISTEPGVHQFLLVDLVNGIVKTIEITVTNDAP